MELIICTLHWCAGTVPGGLLVLVKVKVFSFQSSPVRQVVTLKIRPCNQYLTLRRRRFSGSATASSFDPSLPTDGRGVASSANSSAKVRLGAMVHGSLSGHCPGDTIVARTTQVGSPIARSAIACAGTMQRVVTAAPCALTREWKP